MKKLQVTGLLPDHRSERQFPLQAGACQRIVIGVEYNGAMFHGWQRQAAPAVATVQAELEQAISSVANHPVRLICAGRTDAGVHATAQVAHFDTSANRELKAWVLGVNSQLTKHVRVLWARPVDTLFHARFAATARRYQYWIDNAETGSGIFSGLMTHCQYPLDEQGMHEAAQCLVGEQDFSSFRAAACDSNTAMRNIHHIRVFRNADRVCIEVQANAFLLHMVRNIAGSLMAVGMGQQPSGWIKELLLLKDRRLAAATAKPDGLYLQKVSYPDTFALPEVIRQLY